VGSRHEVDRFFLTAFARKRCVVPRHKPDLDYTVEKVN
jgi:hypothetical protein